MYTISLLGPALLTACIEGFLTGNGYFCTIDPPAQQAVKYYEPEKSCYVDGIFYPRCADSKDKLVKHYHDVLKNDYEKTTVSSCIPFEQSFFCSDTTNRTKNP